MKNFYDIIITPLLTEKATRLNPLNQYMFEVSREANKIEIKNAVEKIYKVKVKTVHTISHKGKKKRIRAQQGYTASWKKAIITLQPGNKIEFA